MIHAIQRHAALLIGMIVTGFVCVKAAPYLISVRGEIGPSIFQSQSPALATTALVVCMVVAIIVAGVVGRFTNTVVGLFVLGVGLFVLDGRTETIRAFAFANAESNPRSALALLAIEALVLAMLALAAVLGVFSISGPLKDIQPLDEEKPPHPLWSGDAMKSAAFGAIVLLAVWFIGQSPMKGQMIAATFIGGMLAGLIGRLFAPHVQPALLFASPILFGAMGYLIAMFMLKGDLDDAYATGRWPAFALATPLDYTAGSLMGVAMGLGWARSFLHHEEQSATANA